ncbi:Tannase/feruloyl esterase [Dactylonectria macrodidyma]|uniref:Carboxylic ester hydrolase n=1 Tax=Dactylonectria macrodidyma TaxID=307937 RepID=A0A9P9F5V7_9HYPO|nr:Tannase/feruloyl esterase [Dactylonectria macrodidyma]
MKVNACLPLTTLLASVAAHSCSLKSLQSVLDTVSTTLNSNGTVSYNATADYAYLLDTSEAQLAFETDVIDQTVWEGVYNYTPCALRVDVTTSEGANFSFGAYLPSTWNQRLIAVAPSGGIDWKAASHALRYGGAAVIGTNNGHDMLDFEAAWVTGENALLDFGWRATHETTVVGKALIAAWYGTSSAYNYFTGCSNGARHAFKQLQSFPEDFDGVMAGSPAWWTTRQQLWNLKQTTYQAPANSSHTIPEALFSVISDEVLRQCDPQDGVVDKVVSDPVGCNLDLTTLLCDSSDSTQCLTKEQLGTWAKLYSDWVDVNQTWVFSHALPGSEDMWSNQIGQGGEETIESQYWYIQNLLGLANFTWEDLTYDTVLLSDSLDPGNASATDFDLSPFYNRGGKLIHWHGLSDATVPPGGSVYFRDNVYESTARQGSSIDDFYRMFLVPGLEHCSGTPSNQDAAWYIAGPSQASYWTSLPPNPVDDAHHDSMLALMDWVEQGNAPEYLVYANYMNNSNPVELKKTRKVCPYPQQAKFIGNNTSEVDSHEDNWKFDTLLNSYG